jgi:DNA-directed RNA polymerase subunit RPC12/RpoP
MTTETRTYKCARCGRSLLPGELEQDLYSGFLLCKNEDQCDEAIAIEDIRYANRIFFELADNDPDYCAEFLHDTNRAGLELKELAFEVARFEAEGGNPHE